MSGIMSMVLGAKTAIAAAVDAYFNLVTLLLPGDGTNGAQNNTFLDSSTNNFTITRNGNTTQGTFSPFSQTGWSVYFDGNASCDLAVASTAQFNWGTSDFCIESFVYPQSFPTAARIINFGDGIFNFEITSSGFLSYFQGSSYTATTGALATNTWTHCVITRQSGTVRMFANGVLVFTNTNTTSKGTSTANIGSFPAGGDTLLGYLSNLRVINGNVPAAYQTSSTTVGASIFTAPTAALTAVSGTALLTCQANRFVDNSGNNLSVTVGAGTPSIQAFSPFAPTAAYSASTNGGSGYFDASGDYLSISDASNLASPGSGDFTAQCWLYVPSLPNNLLGASAVYHLKNDTGTTTTVFIIEITSGGAMNLSTGTALIAGGTAGYVKAGAWNHLFVSRLSGTLRTFVNGTADISIANSTTYNGSVVQIGAWRYSTSDFSINGYIGGFRFQKGTGYSSVTIPTAPYTAITNTSLLLNFTNAGITDATAKNVLETVGNAQISTTQSKFGGSSMYFDGTGDRLKIPYNPNLLFLSGDFTVEMWLYKSANNAYMTACGNLASAATAAWSIIGDSTGNKITWYSNSAFVLESTTSLATSTWYHVAIARSGTTIRLFINGTQEASATNSTNYNVTNDVIVGQDNQLLGGRDWSGYIDDLRITKGYARYTASFTAPTAAFALQ